MIVLSSVRVPYILNDALAEEILFGAREKLKELKYALSNLKSREFWTQMIK